jgi:hypothetical protein
MKKVHLILIFAFIGSLDTARSDIPPDEGICVSKKFKFINSNGKFHFQTKTTKKNSQIAMVRKD